MENEENSYEQLGAALKDFSQAEIQEGVRQLLNCSDLVSFDDTRRSSRASVENCMQLIIKHDLLGSASVKPANLVISWKKLLLVGGAIPTRYMSSTLTAMTILGVLIRGVVHVFDEIDARILAVIHQNSELLPISTADFYVRTSMHFPQTINEALFMERLVDLSGYGAISINCDQLRITEPTLLIKL
jgi:hypothetical protein